MDAQAGRRRLLEKQRELEAIASEPAGANAASSGTDAQVDVADQAITPIDRAKALAAARRREGELARIAAALRRIDEDEYGYCVECGDPIGPAQLELDPAVAKCLSCAGPRNR